MMTEKQQLILEQQQDALREFDHANDLLDDKLRTMLYIGLLGFILTTAVIGLFSVTLLTTISLSLSIMIIGFSIGAWLPKEVDVPGAGQAGSYMDMNETIAYSFILSDTIEAIHDNQQLGKRKARSLHASAVLLFAQMVLVVIGIALL